MRRAPFTPPPEKAVGQSLREAALLGHDIIDTEHLLLALLADTTCTGTRILTDLTAISAHEMYDRLRRQLAEHPHTSAKSVHLTRLHGRPLRAPENSRAQSRSDLRRSGHATRRGTCPPVQVRGFSETVVSARSTRGSSPVAVKRCCSQNCTRRSISPARGVSRMSKPSFFSAHPISLACQPGKYLSRKCPASSGTAACISSRQPGGSASRMRSMHAPSRLEVG
ncbi:Clp protease N-terminal domain-containing protein [Rhodococcus koreensis]|uniref:Clp protease N-terminal domain-containing protein n=1 Tax=Rhodococcus koreensis TaxID=99653 RepID=UPI001FC9FBC6|nr:Clp protease N-terminal domain-containing protein [Rhodococcus koreensis]